MGLRNRTTSRVRDRDLRIGQRDGGRILVRRALEAVRTFGAYLLRRVREIGLPDMTREQEDAADREEHFAETMMGGVSITIGILLAVMLVLWIGTYI